MFVQSNGVVLISTSFVNNSASNGGALCISNVGNPFLQNRVVIVWAGGAERCCYRDGRIDTGQHGSGEGRFNRLF